MLKNTSEMHCLNLLTSNICHSFLHNLQGYFEANSILALQSIFPEHFFRRGGVNPSPDCQYERSFNPKFITSL